MSRSTAADDSAPPEVLILVTGRLAAPGCEAALQHQLELLRQRITRMPGCLSFDLYQDGNEPRRFVSIEKWSSGKEMGRAQVSQDWTAIQVLMDDPIDGWALRPL